MLGGSGALWSRVWMEEAMPAVCSGHDLGVMWLQFARYPLCAFTNVGAHVHD